MKCTDLCDDNRDCGDAEEAVVEDLLLAEQRHLETLKKCSIISLTERSWQLRECTYQQECLYDTIISGISIFNFFNFISFYSNVHILLCRK
jgi:hypothetical protein